VHEVKYDGYRMAARIEGDRVKLLTRSGLDWSEKYPETVQALSKLSLETAYIDGELCGVGLSLHGRHASRRVSCIPKPSCDILTASKSR
jgi:ATP-dependent DNA ligase